MQCPVLQLLVTGDYQMQLFRIEMHSKYKMYWILMTQYETENVNYFKKFYIHCMLKCNQHAITYICGPKSTHLGDMHLIPRSSQCYCIIRADSYWVFNSLTEISLPSAILMFKHLIFIITLLRNHFSRWIIWGTERSRNLPKATNLVNGRAMRL